MIKGSCCCGIIKFELLKTPTMMGVCHCSRCRKLGISTYLIAEKKHFKWIEGQEYLSSYVPGKPFKTIRNFCKVCGSTIGEMTSQDSTFSISANCIDDDTELRIQFHEFVGSKPSWYEVDSQAIQFHAHFL